ncbi:MAG: protein kinase, partial [bacterium]
MISGDDVTGEAVIYKIKDNSNQLFSLKLYYQFHNPKDEPNAEALKRINAIEDPDILRLYDFGTGLQKFQNKFCFEVCQFAEGGNLLSVEDLEQKYTPEFLRSNVIPEIFKGIKRLHDNKIYHCDLKPQNVFYLDKEQTDLIIGDYGSAKTFEQSSEKDLAQTSIAKGTDFYLAPEQARGIISEKNDYYSLGMIVLHLLYPEQVNKSNLRKIIERQFSGKPIIDFDSNFEDLNHLIAGLTLQDINKRWGRNEIERWLAAEKVDVEYPSRATAVPIKLGTVTIETEEELTSYIEGDKSWYANLIEDSEGYGMLLTLLSNLQDLERKRVFDRMIRYYQQDGKEYVKEAIMRYFVPERPVRVEMKSYDFWGGKKLNELVNTFFKQLDDIWKITKLEDLKFHVFQFEFCLRQLESVATGQLKTQIRARREKISALLTVSPK